MKMTLTKLASVVAMIAGFAASAYAVAPDFLDKLDADARPAQDKARDDARRPYQVMQLLDVQEGMTVVDIDAGQGWYTEVLSAAVGSSGSVIAHFGPRGGDAQRQRAERLGNVEPVFESLASVEDNVADRGVFGLMLHHRDTAFLEEVYRVLKPGGTVVVTDHVGSPGMNNDELHRMVKTDARRMIEEAGFEVVEDSDLLQTNADDHTKSVFAPELGRNTDRFLFVIRRPDTD